MRIVHQLVGATLLLVGLALAIAVLYDATEMARLAGHAPESGEAAVALVGLALAAAALAVGGRLLRRPRLVASNAG